MNQHFGKAKLTMERVDVEPLVAGCLPGWLAGWSVSWLVGHYFGAYAAWASSGLLSSTMGTQTLESISPRTDQVAFYCPMGQLEMKGRKAFGGVALHGTTPCRTRHAGFADGIDLFDCKLFNISAVEVGAFPDVNY